MRDRHQIGRGDHRDTDDPVDGPGSLVVEIFRCRQCATPITGPLRELDDLGRLSLDHGTPHLPAGTYLPLRLYPHLDWFGGAPDDELDDVLLNLGDVINTHLGGVLNGCCGIDGCDGVNTFCPNDHEIGIEFSDCWGPHDLRAHWRCIEMIAAPIAPVGTSSDQPID